MEFFFSSLITTFRETLEASVVFIIVLSLLRNRVYKTKGILIASSGAIIGALSAIGFGIGLHALNSEFNNNLYFKITMDSVVLLSIIFFICFMIFGEHNNIKIKNNSSRLSSILISIFLLTFVSYFREGTEVVLFTYKQTSIWGILTGFLVGVLFAVLIFFVIKKIDLKLVLSILTILLIIVTSPVIAKWSDDIIQKKDILYKVDVSSNGANFGFSLLRGLFGIKSSSTVNGLIFQLCWIFTFIPLFIFKEQIKNQFKKFKFNKTK